MTKEVLESVKLRVIKLRVRSRKVASERESSLSVQQNANTDFTKPQCTGTAKPRTASFFFATCLNSVVGTLPSLAVSKASIVAILAV